MKTSLITTVGAAGLAVIAAGALAVPALAATGSPATPTSTSASSAIRPCSAGDLGASFKHTDAGMSHQYGKIILTNVSRTACSTGGYGGLSYVGHGNGTQIGAAAQRDAGTPVKTIVLKPGQKVVSVTSEADAEVYTPSTCRPTHVDGFRVYVPNSYVSTYIQHPTTGCADTHVDLLGHQAFARP